jgi:hypothetical protein
MQGGCTGHPAASWIRHGRRAFGANNTGGRTFILPTTRHIPLRATIALTGI